MDKNPKNFELTEFFKAFLLIEDTREVLPIDNEGSIGAGEIFILDMAGFSLRHILKIQIFTLRAFMKYAQVGW